MPSRLNLYSKAKGYGANRIRSLSPAAWYRADTGVTGTLAASNWADQSGNGRDLAQGSAGSMPIYLPYTGTAYAYLPGVSGNFFSTPDASANSITGDIDIRAYVAMDDWTPSVTTTIVAKWKTPNFSYVFQVDTAGKPLLALSEDGTGTGVATSSAATGLSDASASWLRVTWAAATGVVKFYTSSDGSSWTQLGTDRSIAISAIYNGNEPVYLGQNHDGDIQYLAGRLYRAQIYNGINGTLAVDFIPSDFAETSTNGATAVSSTTGETWTLNSTGAKPAQIVKSASLLGDGSASKMATANFTLDQPFTEYIVVRQVSWTAGDFLTSGTAGAAGITQRTGTPKIGLNAGSGVADNADAALGSKVIVTAVFNGASSSLQVNAGTATTGDPGAGNPGGLSLFSDNAGANYYNGQVYERIAFPAAHNAATRATVQRYLASRHAIAL